MITLTLPMWQHNANTVESIRKSIANHTNTLSAGTINFSKIVSNKIWFFFILRILQDAQWILGVS